jgi:CHAT domain-containing protein
LAGDPSRAVEAIVAELRGMASGRLSYRSPGLARARLRNLGAQLWADAVPEVVRRQFWEQADRITSFTVASDLDNVPWELLYPVDGQNELGFLCAKYPVVRRVYGQGRTRRLPLSSVAYVVPQGSPADAMDEVTRVRARLGHDITDQGVLENLEDLTAMLDSGRTSVVHFACHNKFTSDDGSVVTMAGGPFRPSDLSLAVQRKALAESGPLVFFNACRSAGEIPGLTRMMGWARQFMGAGAGAFLGSLWPVRSSSAHDFADAFYGAFVAEQQPLGQASWKARMSIAEELGDPTWLAYTVYGNPAATAGN